MNKIRLFFFGKGIKVVNKKLTFIFQLLYYSNIFRLKTKWGAVCQVTFAIFYFENSRGIYATGIGHDNQIRWIQHHEEINQKKRLYT